MQFWYAFPGGGARVDVHIIANVRIPVYPNGHVACRTPIALFYFDHYGTRREVEELIRYCKRVYPGTANCSFFRIDDLRNVHISTMISQDAADVPGTDQSLVYLDEQLVLKELFVNENRDILGTVVRALYRDRSLNIEVANTPIAIDDDIALKQQKMEANYPGFFGG